MAWTGRTVPSLPHAITHTPTLRPAQSVIWPKHPANYGELCVRWCRMEGFEGTCWPALSPLSEPISVSKVNGEHKTYLKATFTTWLIPLHCVISRCHFSPPHVCLNAPPSSFWLVRLYWLPKSTCSLVERAHHPPHQSGRRDGGKVSSSPRVVWGCDTLLQHQTFRAYSFAFLQFNIYTTKAMLWLLIA